MSTPENKYKSLFDVLRRLATLYIENVRFTAAEKVTILLSGIAVLTIAGVFSVLALVFIAIGVASLLESFIAPFWSYFIIAGIFLLVITLLMVFKKTLVMDPIARFISKLFLNPPKNIK